MSTVTVNLHHQEIRKDFHRANNNIPFKKAIIGKGQIFLFLEKIRKNLGKKNKFSLEYLF